MFRFDFCGFRMFGSTCFNGMDRAEIETLINEKVAPWVCCSSEPQPVDRAGICADDAVRLNPLAKKTVAAGEKYIVLAKSEEGPLDDIALFGRL